MSAFTYTFKWFGNNNNNISRRGQEVKINNESHVGKIKLRSPQNSIT